MKGKEESIKEKSEHGKLKEEAKLDLSVLKMFSA